MGPTSTPQVWKIGQVRPGDSVLVRKLTLQEAHAQLLATDARVGAVRAAARAGLPSAGGCACGPLLLAFPAM